MHDAAKIRKNREFSHITVRRADSPIAVDDHLEISCAAKQPISPHLSHVAINVSPTLYTPQSSCRDNIVPTCTMLLQNLASKEGKQVVGHNVSQH